MSRSQTSRSQGASKRRPRKANNLSQEDGNSSEPELNLDDEVHKCVRYILCRSSNDFPIKKADIVKNGIPGHARQFDIIMQQVTNILKKIYGVSLTSFEDGATKYYVALCRFPQPDDIEKDRKDDANKVLLMLVLAHLFMSNNVVTEASLITFLDNLNIDFDGTHDLFGNVKEFVNSTMVKQRYIKSSVDDITRKPIYSWGSRAEATISKQKILEFIATIYGKEPNTWNSQNKAAAAQEITFGR